MKKSVAIILSYFFLSTLAVFGSGGVLMSVYGKAVYTETNTPIPDFSIIFFLKENGKIIETKSIKTDAEGYYRLRYLEKGNYEYMFEIPGKGITQVIDFENNPSSDPYAFEIQEGQNVNLNFFIGKGQYTHIEKEIETNKVVNIRFYLAEPPIESAQMESSMLRTTGSGNCNIIIKEFIDSPAADNENLGTARNGNPAGGKFDPLYCINWNVDCQKDKCVVTYLLIEIYGITKIHSANWFKTNFGTNYLPGYEICLRNSIIEHEKVHQEDFIQYVDDNFCKIADEIQNISVKCKCIGGGGNKCSDMLKEKVNQFKTALDSYMKNDSEDNAYALSLSLEKDCKQQYK